MKKVEKARANRSGKATVKQPQKCRTKVALEPGMMLLQVPFPKDCLPSLDGIASEQGLSREMFYAKALADAVSRARRPDLAAGTGGRGSAMKKAVSGRPYAGHSIHGNQWFEIGLSKKEVAGLKKANDALWLAKENGTLAGTMRLLILTGLAHFNEFHPVIFGDSEYCRKEGFFYIDDLLDRKIEASFQLAQPGKVKKGEA